MVSFQKVLNLNYPGELVEFVKKDWRKHQGENLEKFKLEMKGTGGLRGRGTSTGNEFVWEGFEERFDRILKSLEEKESSNKVSFFYFSFFLDFLCISSLTR